MDRIFYNTDIYESYQDYALGGFRVKDGEQINFSLIYTKIYDRIDNLILDFINRGMKANNFDTSKYSKEDAIVDIALLIKGFLGKYPSLLTEKSLQTAILDSEQMDKWLNLEIKDRIKNAPLPTNNTRTGIPNYFVDIDDTLYQEAEDATDKMTFEEYIEQLSLIEL
jgi:hypothetical protein